jgi:hypothetical protein
LIATLKPDYQADNFSINTVADEARKLFKQRLSSPAAKKDFGDQKR